MDEGKDLRRIRKEVGEELRNLLKELDEHKTAARYASARGGPEAMAAEQLLEGLADLQKAHSESNSQNQELKDRINELENKINYLQSLERSTEEHVEETARSMERKRKERGEDEEIGKLRKFLKSATPMQRGESAGSEKGGGFLVILFVINAAFHILWGFSGTANTYTQLFAFAGIVFVFTAFVLYLRYKDPFVGLWAVASLALPWILDFVGLLPELIESTLGAILIFTPFLALYISYRENWPIHYVWLLLEAILLLAMLIYNGILVPTVPTLEGNFNAVDALDTFFEALGDVFDGLIDATKRAMKSLVTTGERLVDIGTGGYYTSMVEQQQDEPVGLYIDNLRASSEVFFEGEPVYLWADIGGKSFREVLRVAASCGIEDTNIEGETEPTQFEVFYQGGEAVQCKFNNLTVPEGEDEENYDVEFRATFDYETWGYVTYTFVDQETKRNMLAQGHDINEELDVPSSLRPIYTPGPVSLDMLASIPQPVGVSAENGVNTAFGIRLTQMWTDGELARVDEVIVMIPPEFELASCDTEIDNVGTDPLCETDPDQCASELKAYTFSNEVAKRFDSMGCRLRLEEGKGIDDVLPPGQQKVQKTFVVRANYAYAMTEDERIEVRDVGE